MVKSKIFWLRDDFVCSCISDLLYACLFVVLRSSLACVCICVGGPVCECVYIVKCVCMSEGFAL